MKKIYAKHENDMLLLAGAFITKQGIKLGNMDYTDEKVQLLAQVYGIDLQEFWHRVAKDLHDLADRIEEDMS